MSVRKTISNLAILEVGRLDAGVLRRTLTQEVVLHSSLLLVDSSSSENSSPDPVHVLDRFIDSENNQERIYEGKN